MRRITRDQIKVIRISTDQIVADSLTDSKHDFDSIGGV